MEMKKMIELGLKCIILSMHYINNVKLHRYFNKINFHDWFTDENDLSVIFVL
jgi:hypothetical protein